MPGEKLGEILSNSILDAVLDIGTWDDWVPVFGGFSTDPTGVTARFIKVRETVIVRVHMGVSGVSDASIFTMTMPLVSSDSGPMFGSLGSHVDKGTPGPEPGMVILPASSTVASLYTDPDLGGWKSFNGKSANFMFIYEVDP